MNFFKFMPYFFFLLFNFYLISSYFMNSIIKNDTIVVYSDYCTEYDDCFDFKKYNLTEYLNDENPVPIINQTCNLSKINSSFFHNKSNFDNFDENSLIKFLNFMSNHLNNMQI